MMSTLLPVYLNEAKVNGPSGVFDVFNIKKLPLFKSYLHFFFICVYIYLSIYVQGI